ncbi:hypothetical protein Cob_v002026 [Colletotrichum orbiculare MAFF 240422]|uniref:Uncharacterized protein n=1 Tax=Colletotrichum orbiculare (strain 104-T / ATCC 96160 / CBS 514.97 / LARS 414 / MAFF 240422) TaxID=1213857 RepID=A0A484G4H0_COLOR|nr:hypothetical protein Cob_v002026 [Colletotrichum orbiculare MAFF 240422]
MKTKAAKAEEVSRGRDAEIKDLMVKYEFLSKEQQALGRKVMEQEAAAEYEKAGIEHLKIQIEHCKIKIEQRDVEIQHLKNDIAKRPNEREHHKRETLKRNRTSAALVSEGVARHSFNDSNGPRAGDGPPFGKRRKLNDGDKKNNASREEILSGSSTVSDSA